MAPRAYWKGYLRLSLVSCPIALYPATSEREKVSFNQINKTTGHRIRYRKVDAETGEEVPTEDIIKGYEVAKGEYVEITDEEMESVALESTKTIDIDEFVPRDEIDDLYNIRPYYIAPDGKVGQDAFVVIRNIIEQMKMVAIGRVVLTSREHVIAISPRDKGLMGTLLRFPYEVRDPAEYFDDIPNVKLTKDMMELARHIVETKSGHFEPEKFEDHYEHALKDLIEKKAKGEKIEAPKVEPTGKVINLMDALRRSVQAEKATANYPSGARHQERPQERGAEGNAAADCGQKGRRPSRNRQGAAACPASQGRIADTKPPPTRKSGRTLPLRRSAAVIPPFALGRWAGGRGSWRRLWRLASRRRHAFGGAQARRSSRARLSAAMARPSLRVRQAASWMVAHSRWRTAAKSVSQASKYRRFRSRRRKARLPAASLRETRSPLCYPAPKSRSNKPMRKRPTATIG